MYFKHDKNVVVKYLLGRYLTILQAPLKVHELLVEYPIYSEPLKLCTTFSEPTFKKKYARIEHSL